MFVFCLNILYFRNTLNIICKNVREVIGTDCIKLQGLEFYGRHGCLPEENVLGQIFTVDLILYLDLHRAGQTDDLNDTVDYASVVQTVGEMVTGKPHKLIESVAEKIAAIILREYGQIERVIVTLHKNAAPIKTVFRDVSVTVDRGRICKS